MSDAPMVSARGFSIFVNEEAKLVIFRFRFEDKQVEISAPPAEARSIAAGFFRAADRIAPRQRLWSIATEVVKHDAAGNAAWVPGGVEYVHANSAREARMKFERARKNGEAVRVVALGPAIGNARGG